MKRFLGWVGSLAVVAACAGTVLADDRPVAGRTFYGEWRIRVKPDQGDAYGRLIGASGLPLFKGAGGRMVGWWKTLVGDLYEHVTIWEYDDMAAYDRAVSQLSRSEPFAKFVLARDPLLAGEESRFLRLGAGGKAPALPINAPLVVHETHRVNLERLDAYLTYMRTHGVPLLEKSGFHPSGPFLADVGRRSEVTYLHQFESLAARDQSVAALAASADGKDYLANLARSAEDVTSRILLPAPFAHGQHDKAADTGPALPHREEIAPGVFVAGYAYRHGSTNCGWVAVGEETLLIDLPRGTPVAECLDLVSRTTGKPLKTLALTGVRGGDGPILQALLSAGVKRVFASPATRAALLAASKGIDPTKIVACTERSRIAEGQQGVEFIPLDGIAAPACAAVHLPGRSVLFAGPMVTHGPRTILPGSDSARWVEGLRTLASLEAVKVVPDSGSWGGPERIDRQLRFLKELRRQVGYVIAQGRPASRLREQVKIGTDYFNWMPYDSITDDDLNHVYRELTIPFAPFNGHEPTAGDPKPHALVLIGDQPHEPGHIEEGLRPAFEAAGIVPHFTVDVRALSAANLAKVKLLVILRDALQRVGDAPDSYAIWVTPEQERAVVEFVEKGGGFLNLHNSLGLYPDDGPYLKLVGGHYDSHGPLERFQVEVADAAHPVTRGVRSFFIADEQHTPITDEGRVHLLLRSRSDDGKVAPAGWAREQGDGRVCHLAPGHTREALMHPMTQRLLRNAARWCLRMKDDEPGGD